MWEPFKTVLARHVVVHGYSTSYSESWRTGLLRFKSQASQGNIGKPYCEGKVNRNNSRCSKDQEGYLLPKGEQGGHWGKISISSSLKAGNLELFTDAQYYNGIRHQAEGAQAPQLPNQPRLADQMNANSQEQGRLSTCHSSAPGAYKQARHSLLLTQLMNTGRIKGKDLASHSTEIGEKAL